MWKCFWLKQSLSCLSISLERGRRLCERVGQTERGATTTEQHRMGKRKLVTQCINQNSKMLFLLSLFPFPPPFFLMYNIFFFLLFFWRTGFTHFSWNSLSEDLCNGNEKKHYLFLTICHKIHGKREVFHMYVNWESVLRVVPSTSEPEVCSLMSALKSRGFISLIVNYLKL